jgi:hypothetical protein
MNGLVSWLIGAALCVAVSVMGALVLYMIFAALAK